MESVSPLQAILKSRLDALQLKHPTFSVRAFARKVGVSPATISLVLSGRRQVSLKLAEELSRVLQFDPQERSEVLAYYQKKSKKSHLVSEGYVHLSLDQYRLIADWRAFAILSLIRTKGFRSNPSWIAKRLGISREDAEDTLQSLLRLGMISRTPDGNLERSEGRYRTTEDVLNLSLQKSHQQTLALAERSLENTPVHQRDFTWVTMPVDPDKMSEAKALIRKFQDDFSALVESGENLTEVYRLGVQFFPLSQLSKNK